MFKKVIVPKALMDLVNMYTGYKEHKFFSDPFLETITTDAYLKIMNDPSYDKYTDIFIIKDYSEIGLYQVRWEGIDVIQSENDPQHKILIDLLEKTQEYDKVKESLENIKGVLK